MDPSPAKKANPDFRQLTDEDGACMRKLTSQVEKHLKLKNQQLRETEEELHDVRQFAVREPSLRICVKRVGLTVTIDMLKVTDFIFFFNPVPLFDLICWTSRKTRIQALFVRHL